MIQLSTGKRINTAADNPASIALSSRLTSEIRGLNQAIRNANDGISMLQTADGAAQSIINMLQKMRELMVQKTNDTNNTNDRVYLDSEISSLKTELSRTRNSTQWNGSNLIDGTGGDGSGNFALNVGFGALPTASVNIQLNFPDIETSSTPTQAQAFVGDATNYQYFAADGKNWTQAQAAANAMTRNGRAGYLANITSQEELNFIETNVIPGGAASEFPFAVGRRVPA